jgi:hypothetical protein
MALENKKIVDTINKLIVEGDRYKNNYDFLDFAAWKNKVEFLLEEIGGQNYVNMFFKCLKEIDQKYQHELEKIEKLAENPNKHSNALFQLQIKIHQQEVQRVIYLLSTLKLQLKASA